jgi:hypothetical protein
LCKIWAWELPGPNHVKAGGTTHFQLLARIRAVHPREA